MCGRYFLDTLPELLAGQFRVHKYPVFPARYNIAPTQIVPVVRMHGAEREIALLRWGLIPFWAKDVRIAAKLINARSESVHEKPAFRAAFRQRRCLVPVSGYYEWQLRDGRKQPWCIRPTADGCFAVAGIWEHWTSPEGEVRETCALLTVDANAKLAQVHDRMPVLLDESGQQQWVDPKAQGLSALLVPAPDSAVACFPVSTRVNRAANDDPSLIAPIVLD